ncbi:MAG: rhomboid family intramembrane serine protease [Vicingaceae bacterium]|nr:rhomboid family intramembrane serine protease [Vicingaceae bacterium]
MDKTEKHQFLNSLLYPFLFVFTIAFIFFIEVIFEVNFSNYGIYPRKLTGLKGVIFAPFLHGDASHLINNAIPLLILGTTLFYFYKEIALKVFLWIFLMGGFWTWVSAREAMHIGASGVIYGLFSFLLISGFIRRNIQLIAISFFVVFIYGSMIWGIFPIKKHISFESHFWGFVAGLILSIYYRKQGPQKKVHHWEEDDEDEDEDDSNIHPNIDKNPIEITYIFKENKE